jgi:hypothetical protein
MIEILYRDCAGGPIDDPHTPHGEFVGEVTLTAARNVLGECLP